MHCMRAEVKCTLCTRLGSSSQSANGTWPLVSGRSNGWSQSSVLLTDVDTILRHVVAVAKRRIHGGAHLRASRFLVAQHGDAVGASERLRHVHRGGVLHLHVESVRVQQSPQRRQTALCCEDARRPARWSRLRVDIGSTPQEQFADLSTTKNKKKKKSKS